MIPNATKNKNWNSMNNVQVSQNCLTPKKS